MALVLLEGLDRTGKSTVAAYFESIGYELIHFSAPPKGITSDQYMQQIVDLISSASIKDVVLDRSHYGELVCPHIYGRKPLLTEEDIDSIREIEEAVGVQRILMHDPDIEAHWKRCVDNKEPLNKAQFARARSLYSQIGHKYFFETVTLPQFLKEYPDAQQIADNLKANDLEQKTFQVTVSGDETLLEEVDTTKQITSTYAKYPPGKTPEQQKLDVANAINDILSKRILKGKGSVYDGLENEMRNFLNSKLGKLLGGSSNELSLTPEEIKFYKAMYARAQSKV